jgi:hypothetical protein
MTTMTTVLCLCRVDDFDAWRPLFERDVRRSERGAVLPHLA